MTNYIKCMLVAAAILLSGCEVPPQVIDAVTDCQEDMPCWDCKVMGNRICGPTSDAYSACLDWATEGPNADRAARMEECDAEERARQGRGDYNNYPVDAGHPRSDPNFDSSR